MNLSINRVFSLLKREMVINRKQMLLFFIAVMLPFGFFMLIVSDEYDNKRMLPPDAGEIVFGLLLILGGFVFTTSIFKEYRTHANRIQYLMIPASHAEKFISKWIISLPGFILLAFVIFSIGYNFFSWVIAKAFKVYFISFFELQWSYFFNWIFWYFVLHSIYLLLSTLFNRYPILKSVVSIFLFFLIGMLVCMLFFRVIYYDQFEGFFNPINPGSFYIGAEPAEWLMQNDTKLKWGISLILVPYLYLISYFKIKEKEA